MRWWLRQRKRVQQALNDGDRNRRQGGAWHGNDGLVNHHLIDHGSVVILAAVGIVRNNAFMAGDGTEGRNIAFLHIVGRDDNAVSCKVNCSRDRKPSADLLGGTCDMPATHP